MKPVLTEDALHHAVLVLRELGVSGSGLAQLQYSLWKFWPYWLAVLLFMAAPPSWSLQELASLGVPQSQVKLCVV